jgi:hypothetical protein
VVPPTGTAPYAVVIATRGGSKRTGTVKEIAMDEEKWMKFIQSYWAMLSYWEIIKLYRTHPLRGAFFHLTALACRNELLMRISHTVHLCQQIAKEYDVGVEAKATLAEIEALFQRGALRHRKGKGRPTCTHSAPVADPHGELDGDLGEPT